MKKKSGLSSQLALYISLTVISAGIALPLTTYASNNTQQAIPSLAPMLEKSLPAVVSIQVAGAARQGDTEQDSSARFTGQGSGVIIDAAKGYLLTNAHVINDAQTIRVKLNDGREYNAKTIGSDRSSDIALLQLQDANNLTDIKIADSDALRVGDFTVAVGSPFGLGQTATSGIVSALGRSGLNAGGLENYIQTDAAINQGNSGGALLNLKGELIGINTAILALNGGNVGIGFAIPSNLAQRLAQQFIHYGEARRGLLGIRGTELNDDLARAFKLNVQRGAFISEVLPDSGSAKAGLKAGDVIVQLNHQPLNSFAELRSKISTTEPGENVELGILRAGQPLDVTVTLDAAPKLPVDITTLLPALKGVTLNPTPPKESPSEIVLESVAVGSPAAQIGLQKDDVIIGINRETVHTLDDVEKVMKSDPAITVLHIARGGDRLYLLTN